MGEADKWGKPCHLHAVRCPHCGKPNDFREVGDAVVEGEGKNRPTVECDHCHGVIEVVKVQPAVLVWVKKWEGGPKAERKRFAILRCPMCKLEVYPNEETGNFFLNGGVIGRGSRCPTIRNDKRCSGTFQGQVLVEEVGERHQVLTQGQLVFKCMACKAEFYDRGFTVNEVGQHLCTCGEPLVRQ